MSLRLLTLAALLAAGFSSATAQLQPGDLAVVGYHGDNPDAVALVALVPIAAGTEFAITDNGWQASGQFRANEGTFRYTVPAPGLLPGDVLRLDEPAGIAFSTGGDQALVYTGPDGAPSFVYGLNNEGDSWQDDATSSNTSALPAGLQEGLTAVALVEADNASYAGPTSGTREALLQAISTPANWTTDDAELLPFPESFTVDGGGANLAPSFTTVLPDTTIAAGETLTFDYDAFDADGDALTFSLVPGTPIDAVIDPATGVLTWTPAAAQGGTAFAVVVAVTDGVPDDEPDDAVAATVTVLEESANRPPAFDAAAPYAQAGLSSEPFAVQIPATDPDGDALAYSIVSGPDEASFADGLLTWEPPDSAAVFQFELEVSDGETSVRRPFFAAVQYALFLDTETDETRAAIRERFAPDQTLGYGPGRDTLYALVEAFPDGTVEGIYTGYEVALPAGVDPSSYLFQRDLNAEHTWPQSLGAGDEPQRSDLHILYPARVNVNADRGSNPYADIPDAQTDTWYRLAEQQSAIPADDIDAWSEATNGAFEPRESRKGDVARALFYFASVYEAEAAAGYLEGQLETLRLWHEDDAVSPEEIVRSGLIRRHQGNVNPFILDPLLPTRAFVGLVQPATDPATDQAALALSAPAPNPARGAMRLTLTAGEAGRVRAEAFDVLGRRVATLHDGPLAAGQQTPLALDASALAPGLYVVRATSRAATVTRRFVVTR